MVVLLIFLNSFASVILRKKDKFGNPIETQIISDSSGNAIEVNVMFLEKEGYFFGEMLVFKEDKTTEKFVSYTDNYNFYTRKINYAKYERPILYNTIKWTTITAITISSAVIMGPIIGSQIGIAGAFGAINGSTTLAIIGGSGSLVSTIAIDNLIQNHKKGKWLKVEVEGKK